MGEISKAGLASSSAQNEKTDSIRLGVGSQTNRQAEGERCGVTGEKAAVTCTHAK